MHRVFETAGGKKLAQKFQSVAQYGKSRSLLLRDIHAVNPLQNFRQERTDFENRTEIVSAKRYNFLLRDEESRLDEDQSKDASGKR